MLGTSLPVQAAADSLFGSLEVNDLQKRPEVSRDSDAVQADIIRAYNRQARKQKWQNVRRSVGLDFPIWPITYTIDRYHFMGEPVVAKITSFSGEMDYYLVVFHFNIPVTKAVLAGPMKFGFVRIGAKVVGVDGQKQLIPVRTISIFPVNEKLPINREDERTTTVRVEPQWFGASGGYMQREHRVMDKYDYNLPTVMGTVSRFGDVHWTYYPAKAQPVIQGAQTGFAIIGVPRTGVTELQLLCTMQYNLQWIKAVPFPGQCVYDSVKVGICKTDPVLSVANLRKMHVADLPEDIKTRLKELENPPAPAYSLIQGPQSDDSFVEKDNVLYKIRENGKAIRIP